MRIKSFEDGEDLYMKCLNTAIDDRPGHDETLVLVLMQLDDH
jgi:hypothetical protein